MIIAGQKTHSSGVALDWHCDIVSPLYHYPRLVHQNGGNISSADRFFDRPPYPNFSWSKGPLVSY
jgi:hypothetical protein